MKSSAVVSNVLACGLLALRGAQAVTLSPNTQDLFDESMNFLDTIYDRSASYLYYFYYPLAAGPHETRSSVWYATGLLQRNKGDDVEQAVKIIKAVIGDQEKNKTLQWFGDYTVYPEQPTVGTEAYPAVIYNSWDPNWRGFIGTNLIVIYEEFQHLLPQDVQGLIVESMVNNTIGDSYRVGGVDDDNLFPSYSNPSLMRAVASGWTGRKVNDANMTAAGEMYAQEILDLFNLNNTLSEFNSGTYAGVSIYALTLWAKYMPQDSIMGQNGARMLKQVWETTAALYNPLLRNLAGPWDRSYGYDMNKYVAILGIYLWSLLGKDQAFGEKSRVWSLAHADDFEYAPLIAVLAPFHDSLVSDCTIASLKSTREHTVTTSAFAPPHDMVPRNVTTWMYANLTIGAESFRQDVLGGARADNSQWNPAVVQWARPYDSSVGYMTLHASEMALDVGVAPYALNLTYPAGNSSSSFTFLIAPNPLGQKRDITDLADINGLKFEVGGTVDPKPQSTFCGLVGGTCSIIHGFEFWNLTFTMPAGSTEVPSITFKFELE
ncbi:uncharacterized protein B0I36DRAFT_250683 [Microdochium trichocladiopsis]|uniref:Uncharacterized protein n=1 Tax=Microdochium trichocladiopsis TaxID=1682393 RepID=A0A9P8XXF4_9PEZI|nr:uncharacterized protein B0I36DRAFT_250683 [Microdochium trichocladiopsis]KAH7024365.1 hypothetical protein B0I36DRAFT_250683 [Microdochium trichocladiopsis]